jgi:hypothetical protein
MVKLEETDINGCETFREFPVNIEFIPNSSIVRKGENLIICKDSGMAHYNWFLNGEYIPSPDRQFYYRNRTIETASNFYEVRIESNFGCRDTSNQILIGAQVNIFPNPAKDNLTIDFNSLNLNSGSIEIRDINAMIKEEKIIPSGDTDQHFNIDLRNYNPGIYTYTIRYGKEVYSTGKFIVH